MEIKQYLASIGRKGGMVKSEKKAASCRENARKPRPNARTRNKLGAGKK